MPAAEPAQQRRVRLESETGVEQGILQAWSEAGPVLQGRAAASDWLELRLEPQAPGDTPEPAWEVELAQGMWLPGRPVGGDADFATWRHASGLILSLDSLWLRRLSQGRLRARSAAEEDLLWLRTPAGGWDHRSGWMVRWQEDGIAFREGQEGPDGHPVPWESVAALQLVEESVPEWAGGQWLVLQGGGRLLGRVLSTDDQRLQFQLPWRTEVSVPWSAVQALRRRGPRVQLLAEQAPLAARGPASEVLDWTPRQGCSVEGRPLRVAGADYATGFGTRAPSELRVRVAQPGRFLAWAGVDDETAAFRVRSPVRFRLLLGQTELASVLAEPGQPPVRMDVAVPQAGELELRTEPAEAAAGAHGDWLDPVYLPELPAPG